MKTEIRKEIFKKVKELYHLIKKQEEFIPGKTSVNYGGRVYDEKEILNLIDASLDFWLTAGKYNKTFEKELAEFIGVRYAVTANSGSSANLLAVTALTSPKLGERALKSGDEVITTACGFPTTLNPIIQNNLIPVLIDVELGTYNIDVNKLEGSISEKTKAIFVPHTLGNPVNLDIIMKISKKYHLWFIEDNCDSLGSKYKENHTGTFGHIATCSFYPPHHITMGEGGALLTDDLALKRIILSFRDWGRDCWCDPGRDDTCGKRFKQQFGGLPSGYDHKYVYSHIGYNMKITDLQAAIGVAQLKKLPGFVDKRKENFKFLYDGLKKYEDYFILPVATSNSKPSWFGFPILVKENAPFTRDDIISFLEGNKIATRMLFGGNLVKQPAYKGVEFRIPADLRNTDLVMNNLFWIGVYPGINEEKIVYMLKAFETFLEKNRRA